MKLQPTITGTTDAFSIPDFLQLLERSRANGRVTMGEHALRVRDGEIVKATGPVQATVAAMMSAEGSFEWRAVRGRPNGDQAHPITALLMRIAFEQAA